MLPQTEKQKQIIYIYCNSGNKLCRLRLLAGYFHQRE